MKKKLISTLGIIFAVTVINLVFPLNNNAEDVENIVINQPISLNYKTKQEIYNIRKSYVAKSIFASPNYEPSEEVFGGIEDNKPWISIDWCYTYNPNNPDNFTFRINGPSCHSRDLINPSLPVFIHYPYGIPATPEETPFCSKFSQIMVPLNAVYTKSKKEVEITYKKLPDFSNDNSAYQFTAINAKDFGYNYMYLDKSKSTYKIRFISDDNLSTSVKEISDFIHLGTSCRVSGGCNNWSRMRDDLQFKPIKTQLSSSSASAPQTNTNQKTAQAPVKKVYSVNLGNNAAPAPTQTQTPAVKSDLPQLYIKLWKNKPSSPSAPADLNVKFVFKR